MIPKKHPSGQKKQPGGKTQFRKDHWASLDVLPRRRIVLVVRNRKGKDMSYYQCLILGLEMQKLLCVIKNVDIASSQKLLGVGFFDKG